MIFTEKPLPVICKPSISWGRQLLVAGSADQRQKGLQWIERSAEGGYAEAQYRLVTYYENEIHIMRDNPSRGIALLQSAAEQNHLPAMGALALAYEKGISFRQQDILLLADLHAVNGNPYGAPGIFGPYFFCNHLNS